MIIFLYGSDSYRRQKNLKEITNQFVQKNHFSSLEQFDFDVDDNTEETAKLKEFLAHQSMFSAKKMAVLKNTDNLQPEIIQEILKNYFQSADVVLVISAQKLSSGFKKFIKEPTIVQEFAALDEEKFIFFIKRETQKRNLNLTPSAIQILVEIFQSDTWSLITELDKLSLLNIQKPIDAGKIIEISGYIQNYNFFTLTNTLIYSKQTAQKLPALERLFSQNEEIQKVFNFLAKQSYRFPQLLQKFADYDVAIKSGKMDYEEALLDLALT